MQKGLASSGMNFINLGFNSFVSAFVALIWGSTLSFAVTALVMLVGGAAAILLCMRSMRNFTPAEATAGLGALAPFGVLFVAEALVANARVLELLVQLRVFLLERRDQQAQRLTVIAICHEVILAPKPPRGPSCSSGP